MLLSFLNRFKWFSILRETFVLIACILIYSKTEFHEVSFSLTSFTNTLVCSLFPDTKSFSSQNFPWTLFPMFPMKHGFVEKAYSVKFHKLINL